VVIPTKLTNEEREAVIRLAEVAGSVRVP
jgi:hypothetical protein